MTDKFNTRNKFARKICSKMEKLNNDIKLLIKVDTTLKNQSGGALLQDLQQALSQVKAKASTENRLNYEAANSKINELASELDQTANILTESMQALLLNIQTLSNQLATDIQVNPVLLNFNDINASYNKIVDLVQDSNP